MNQSLNLLDDLENYRRLFTDADFFRPAVEEICRRHQLTPAGRMRVGVPGTCPVFIVEEHWLVKLFGRLFDGGASYAAEHAAARLVAEHARIPTPALLAAGELQPAGVDWPWPYMVFEYIPSTSLGQARSKVSQADQLRLAVEIGAWMRELHAAAIPAAGPFARDWHAHLGLLDEQRPGCAARHAEWGGLPVRLAGQIDAYLLPATELVLPGEHPHLIHADLTEDHVLGRVTDGQWTTLALIDFGDACTGGLLYELCALHLSLFGVDRRLLAAFLNAYGYSGPGGADFARRAMSCALLHEFNVLEVVPQRAALREVETLEELGERLWFID